MTNSQMLKLSEIMPDPNQPRKFFDQLALDELTTSAKTIGIFQNILVRPCTPKVQNGRKAIYMIVVGERRYKASVMAGLKEIPATIRELTDEQALEIQIVENLLRKDVQPMEEAVAFKSLFNHNHFAVEEIAARVGKSASYVASRIKLCDLLPDFQEILFNNKMQLTDAMKLSRFDLTFQKQLLEERAKGWKKQVANWELGNISWYLNRAQNNLNKATFKLNDTLLYKEAGSCTVCPHNSACNPVLFEEFAKEKICHNPVCFGIKTDRAYVKKLEELQQKPDVLFIANGHYLDDQEKHKMAVAEQMGITVLQNKAFDEVEEVDPPEPWEKYWEEQKEWRIEEEDSEDEITKVMLEEKENWQELMNDYDEEVKKLAEAKANGSIVKAFVVCGSDQGKMVDIILNTKAKNTGAIKDDVQQLQVEIQTLEEKEKRNQELDREKINKASMLALLDADYKALESQLMKVEVVAMLVMIIDHSYKARTFIKDVAGSSDLFDIANYLHQADKQRLERLGAKITRIAMFEKLISDAYCDYGKYGAAVAMQNVAAEIIPVTITEIIQEQAQKATKRAENIQRQIDAAKQKIVFLQLPPAPVEEQPQELAATLPPAEQLPTPVKAKNRKKEIADV